MAKNKPRPLHKRRRAVQVGFLALTLIVVFVIGGNAEAWCPFGGVEAAYEYITEGTSLCSLGVSNFYILAAVLGLTLLLRRAFCGYMCPLGTLSELLFDLAKRLGIKPKVVTGKLDAALSLLKYPVLAYILYISWKAAELLFRGFDPIYALISRDGKDITYWAYVVLGLIFLSSLFVRIPFCRWLCPMAAVMSPFSRIGLFRIKRHDDPCTSCKLCDKACPVGIPVSQVKEVTHARCYSCMECIEACPPKAAGSLTFSPAGKSTKAWSQGWIIGAVLAISAVAAGADYLWPLPSFVKVRGEEPASVAIVEVGVTGITCRGSANRLWAHMQREDEFELMGYLRVEAWTGGEFASVRVLYDPDLADDEFIRQVITAPYVDDEGEWVVPDYEIENYDPFGLGL